MDKISLLPIQFLLFFFLPRWAIKEAKEKQEVVGMDTSRTFLVKEACLTIKETVREVTDNRGRGSDLFAAHLPH